MKKRLRMILVAAMVTLPCALLCVQSQWKEHMADTAGYGHLGVEHVG